MQGGELTVEPPPPHPASQLSRAIDPCRSSPRGPLCRVLISIRRSSDSRVQEVQYSELRIDALLLLLTTFSARNHALNLSSSSPRGPLCRVLISTRRSSDSKVQQVQSSERKVQPLPSHPAAHLKIRPTLRAGSPPRALHPRTAVSQRSSNAMRTWRSTESCPAAARSSSIAFWARTAAQAPS